MEQNTFDNITSELLLFSGASTETVNLNLTSPNSTIFTAHELFFELSGTTANSENLTFNETFLNDNDIRNKQTISLPEFTLEDYSLGDISGRHSGTYTVTGNVSLTNLIDVSCNQPSGGCTAEDTSSESSSNYNSLYLNITRFSSIKFRAVTRGSGTVTCTYSCSEGQSEGVQQHYRYMILH